MSAELTRFRGVISWGHILNWDDAVRCDGDLKRNLRKDFRGELGRESYGLSEVLAVQDQRTGSTVAIAWARASPLVAPHVGASPATRSIQSYLPPLAGFVPTGSSFTYWAETSAIR